MKNTNNKTGWKIWAGGLLVLALAASGFLFMALKQKTALAGETDARVALVKEGPVVRGFRAGTSLPAKGLVLIGEARPYQSITLYAKTSGYMDKILVDKGDNVKEGQLLATIVSPETDQAYNAALADMLNKEKISKRDQVLVKKEYISTEDAESSETALKMAQAQVESLKQQMEYKNLTAPFSGTVTARYADAVAQNDAAYLQIGYPVIISTTDNPDLQIKAKVSRISGELDPKTRMMLVEIDISNTKREIIPGSYLQVTLPQQEKKNLTIPSEALVIRSGKFFVPVLDSLNQLHYKSVTVGKNDGANVAILSGVEKGEIVGLNVSPELPENQKVKVQL
jgi:membrane fusion protein (multidrug efflux system)